VLSPAPIEMAVGVEIDYRLRVRGLPMRWRSRIAVWQPPHRFVDEQVRGPYRLWHHEHSFESKDLGTLVRDHVRHAVHGGPLEPLVHRWLVRRDVERIFAYRAERLAERFGERPAERPVAAIAPG
jgi:ligand-binding SRPBCC domain-containing protein